MKKQIRLAIILTHPIQYYSPLLRQIARQQNIYSVTYYLRNPFEKPRVDKEFGREVKWDIPLLDQYNSEFLPSHIKDNNSKIRNFNYALLNRLKAGNFDYVLICGCPEPFRMITVSAAFLLGIKVLIRDDANLIARQRSPLKVYLKKVFFRIFNHLTFRFLAVGTRNKEYYLAYGIPSFKIDVMPWAIDNMFFLERAVTSRPLLKQLRQDLGITENQIVMLYVGKFSERKGIRDLLTAFIAAYNDLNTKPTLVFVGDGELRGEIENAMINCAGIKIAGFKNQTELPLYYELSDLIVLPSKWLETWGLVINEGMSVGRPAIVSDKVGCVPDLIIPDKTGWIFEEGNIQELALLLKQVLKNKAKLESMQIACLEHIAKFSIEQNLSILNEIMFEGQAT